MSQLYDGLAGMQVACLTWHITLCWIILSVISGKHLSGDIDGQVNTYQVILMSR